MIEFYRVFIHSVDSP